MDKKGMELSINMVVVIILGIVLLGMGIYFVTSIVDQTIDVSGKVDGQLMEQLRRDQFRSGQRVAILNTQETVARGKTATFVLGFVNKEGVERKFRVVTDYSTDSPANAGLKASDRMKRLYGPSPTDDNVREEMNKHMLHLFKEVSYTVTLDNNEDYFINLIFSPPKDIPQGQYLYTVYVCRDKLVPGDDGVSETAMCKPSSDMATPMLYTGNRQRLTATVR